MGLLAKVAIYVTIAIVANDWTNGFPVPKSRPLEPDVSLVEKSGAGPRSFADESYEGNVPASSAHNIFPREVSSGSYLNKNDDDQDYPEAAAESSSVVKRQDPNPSQNPTTVPEEDPDDKQNSTSPIQGRRMSMG